MPGPRVAKFEQQGFATVNSGSFLQSNIELLKSVAASHSQFHYQILDEWQVAPKPSCNPVRDTNFHIRSEPNELPRKHTEWPGWSELGMLDASGGTDPRGHGHVR